MQKGNLLTSTKVNFPSKDGLIISADFYPAKDPRGFIVLCHRSHFNRGEYQAIAPRLVTEGFSCLAIDQRSGMNVLGYKNETSTLAKEQGLRTGYLDARPDIEAAIEYAFKRNRSRPIVLLGSSYSASLSLLIGKDTDKIESVIAFSPGEYLKGINLSEAINGFSKPIFATSAKKEFSDVKKLFRHVNKKHVTYFTPRIEGFHGAKSLWPASSGHEFYWKSLLNFLRKD